MNLVFLHGPPATGKYTVGRELAALTGYRFFHNHLVVDEVLKLHAFGTPGFVEMRDRRWRESLAGFAREQPPGVVFTFNPENSVPQEFIDWLFGDYAGDGVRVLSVELVASEAIIESRLATDQRRQFKKLTDVEFYRRLRAQGAFRLPVVPRSDLRVDTERLSPAETARQIVAHFVLDLS